MSEIEIPQRFREAWQSARLAVRHYLVTSNLADLAVFLLAGWMQERFEREHHTDKTYCHECQTRDLALVTLIGKYDPRHDWTPEQWQGAATKMLEGKP